MFGGGGGMVGEVRGSRKLLEISKGSEGRSSRVVRVSREEKVIEGECYLEK